MKNPNPTMSHTGNSKDTMVAALIAQTEVLRTGFRGAFSKFVHRLNQFTEDQVFSPPVIRELEAAAIVEEITKKLEALRETPGAVALFVGRLTRAIKNIESGRAVSLNPPGGSHTGPQKYFADLLRDAWLEPPDPIEAGRFYNLSHVGGHSDDAGWCFWFSGGTGGVYGLGDRPADLKHWRVHKQEFTDADTREFQRQIADAYKALAANRAKRHGHP